MVTSHVNGLPCDQWINVASSERLPSDLDSAAGSLHAGTCAFLMALQRMFHAPWCTLPARQAVKVTCINKRAAHAPVRLADGGSKTITDRDSDFFVRQSQTNGSNLWGVYFWYTVLSLGYTEASEFPERME